MRLGSEEQEIEIFRHAYDRCLGLACPVCMTECRALMYFAMMLVKLRAGMISDEELENDQIFQQAILYINAFLNSKKELVNKILSKGEILEGEFVEEKKVESTTA